MPAILLVMTVPTFVDAAEAAPTRLKQGEVVVLTVSVDPKLGPPVGEFGGGSFLLYSTGQEGRYAVLLGADMQQKPGVYDFIIRSDQGAVQEPIRIEILAAEFGIQELNLPQDQVELDAETLARVKWEQEKILSVMSGVRPDRLWNGGFIPPVEGRIQNRFGFRRIINGEPRSPHSGEDISASKGTPVLAANDGVVVYTADQFFSGKSVVVDHGLGLFTMYFHLDSIEADQGAGIKKGQRLGTVGASGRATGPHLHWGARLNGARVNPFSLLEARSP